MTSRSSSPTADHAGPTGARPDGAPALVAVSGDASPALPGAVVPCGPAPVLPCAPAVVPPAGRDPGAAAPPGESRLFTRQLVLVMVGMSCAWLAHGMALWAIAPLLVDLGFDPALGGVGLAVVAVSALLCRLVVGPRIDRQGGRATAIGGTALLFASGVAYVAAAAVGSGEPVALALAVLGAALQGTGFGAMTTASLAIVGDVAPLSRRGEAIGYYGVSQPIIQGLAATLSFAIVDAGGFALLFAAVAAAGAVGTVLFMGLHATPQPPPEPGPARRAARLDRAIAIPVVACGSLSFVGGALVLTIPILGFAVGISNPGVFYLASAVSGVLARLLTGRLSDQWGRARVAVPGLLLLAASLVVLVAGADIGLAIFVITGVAYGIAAAGALPALQALVLDRSPAARRGTSSAAIGVAFDIGFGVGSIAIGAIVGLAGAGTALMAAAITPLVAAALVTLDARPTGGRR